MQGQEEGGKGGSNEAARGRQDISNICRDTGVSMGTAMQRDVNVQRPLLLLLLLLGHLLLRWALLLPWSSPCVPWVPPGRQWGWSPGPAAPPQPLRDPSPAPPLAQRPSGTRPCCWLWAS